MCRSSDTSNIPWLTSISARLYAFSITKMKRKKDIRNAPSDKIDAK